MGTEKKIISNKKKEKVFQARVRLPESLHRAFKAKCATEGQKITDVLEKLIRSYIGK